MKTIIVFIIFIFLFTACASTAQFKQCKADNDALKEENVNIKEDQDIIKQNIGVLMYNLKLFIDTYNRHIDQGHTSTIPKKEL